MVTLVPGNFIFFQATRNLTPFAGRDQVQYTLQYAADLA
jgi:hypothetical protein